MTLDWIGLSGTNTLAYWTHSQDRNKVKCYECWEWKLKKGLSLIEWWQKSSSLSLETKLVCVYTRDRR
jgi:hypothetical protein